MDRIVVMVNEWTSADIARRVQSTGCTRDGNVCSGTISRQLARAPLAP
jgi:hypothetical protein